jgi:hypothetical protein
MTSLQLEGTREEPHLELLLGTGQVELGNAKLSLGTGQVELDTEKIKLGRGTS